MKWKYYIPSVWNPDERHAWEDIWLLPDDQAYQGGSIWLTIDSLTSDTEFRTQEDLLPRQIPAEGFVINGTDMVVGVNDFSEEELLHWVEVWLHESGLPVSGLIEGTFEEFKDSNEEARAVSQAIEKTAKENN
jgi:hypothetical protein